MPDVFEKDKDGNIKFMVLEEIQLAVVDAQMVGAHFRFRASEDETPQTVQFVFPADKAEQFAQRLQQVMKVADTTPPNKKN